MLEVDEPRVEPVSGCTPLVLVDERDRLQRQRLAGLVGLGQRGHEALRECDDALDGLDRRLRVADPQLDRPEARVGSQVPPDVGVVRKGARPRPALDQQLELLPRGERGREARARERLEDLRARRSEPGWSRLPEGRVGRRGRETPAGTSAWRSGRRLPSRASRARRGRAGRRSARARRPSPCLRPARGSEAGPSPPDARRGRTDASPQRR